ncbi:unnamed protein product [Calicophoron daubneyi]|uniref:Uncharacterized protein n=1 Tax=Calicophoron daubneyi TaxID=300641 RepID=A0AAV2TQK8_CALDB
MYVRIWPPGVIACGVNYVQGYRNYPGYQSFGMHPPPPRMPPPPLVMPPPQMAVVQPPPPPPAAFQTPTSVLPPSAAIGVYPQASGFPPNQSQWSGGPNWNLTPQRDAPYPEIPPRDQY